MSANLLAILVSIFVIVIGLPSLTIMFFLCFDERDPYDEEECRATVDRSNGLSGKREE